MNRPHVAHKFLMVRPTTFGFNIQSAASNPYMHKPSAGEKSLRDVAVSEFDAMVAALRAKDIELFVWDNVPQAPIPDAVFPNNWLTTWSDGTLILYPMAPPNRRTERQPELVESLHPIKIIDLSPKEKQQLFLEGTGAMVFDHDHRIVYSALSVRCNEQLLRAHAEQLGYHAMPFHTSHNGTPVYHTNLVISIMPKVAVICTEIITDAAERTAILDTLQKTNHEIIAISADQMARFCGNVLTVANKKGQEFIVLSQGAFDAFTPAQRHVLGNCAELLPVPLPTIERIGGGSARCMLAELCF